ncbi:ribbon-helix-helix protein, CopG family [Inquilinus limosus]|uniref:ribbon-helix-helix protein, CopG family n=1 Tax=Inquilinus limosus TaxID=171674 RepID=UPI003F1641CE
MARPRGQRQAVRLSVTLDERDHATIQRLAADLDLSTAWLVRRAISEFVARHGAELEPELPLRRSGTSADRQVRRGEENG